MPLYDESQSFDPQHLQLSPVELWDACKSVLLLMASFHMISTYAKDFSWEKWPNFPDFKFF
jgi:hypothetical protein